MLRVFGSRQIRNRATMGGNLVTASPIGDSAPVLLALDAKVVLASLAGERTLPIGEFFVSYRKTALQPGEIFKTILIPRGVRRRTSRAKRRGSKFPSGARWTSAPWPAAFVVDLDQQKSCAMSGSAYGGVAAMPSRAKKTEAALLGKVWSEETIASALPILRTEFTPISDVRGSADYRSGLITSLLEKFLTAESRPGCQPAPALPQVMRQWPGICRSVRNSSRKRAQTRHGRGDVCG